MALWRVRLDGKERWARGPVGQGPREFISATLDELLSSASGTLREALDGPGSGRVPRSAEVLVPAGGQPIWAAGVTYRRTRHDPDQQGDDPYARVYDAERPELFLKASPGEARGPGEPVGIRPDSEWNAPEPELGVVADRNGRIVAYLIGNDVSARSIEAENPLYLPQAKVYAGSCALGPCLVPVEDAPPLSEMRIDLTIERPGSSQPFQASLPLSELRRSPDDLVSWLWRAQVFPVGAFLLTGTAIVPPRQWSLRTGDRVAISITGLGRLENSIVEAGPDLDIV
jgi:2-dehydro-3-deoxy-D-arabinonate dehydratase